MEYINNPDRESGPCVDTDIEATKLLCQFKGLCTDVRNDFNNGTLIVSNHKIHHDKLEKANSTINNILFKSWKR